MSNHSFRARRLCQFTGISLVLFAMAAVAGGNVAAQGKGESAVKLTATAGKIDKDGKQTITIKMKVAAGWHAYANDVKNETFQANKTTVSVAGSNKVETVAIDYPPGLRHTEDMETFYIYEGNVEIVAKVKRASSDNGPLEVTVKFVTCNDKECKPPETVKLEVK